MRPVLASENPKSIMRRTAIGTTSVAAEATLRAISASTIRVRWAKAYGASGFRAPSETRDVLAPASAADDIARSAPQAIPRLYVPLFRLNQGGRRTRRAVLSAPTRSRACFGRRPAL